MPRIESEEWSKIGDGNQDRHTINYSDGSSRTVDYREDGGYTVTDTDRWGGSKTGDGDSGITGNVVRINEWD